MKKYLALALVGFSLITGAAQSKEQGRAPKECFPFLRIPPEEYVYSPAVFYPPDRPIPYSVYYYNLYQQFCAGEPAEKCIWACEKVPTARGAALKVGG